LIVGLKVEYGINEKIKLFVKNVMALSFVFLDFLNDAFDSILKRKSILLNILIEEEALPLVNSTVVQNNKEKLTSNSRGISRGPGRGRVNLPASRNCGNDLESGLPAASGNSVKLGHARGRCVRGRGVRGSFNGRSGNSVVPASQKIEEWIISSIHGLKVNYHRLCGIIVILLVHVPITMLKGTTSKSIIGLINNIQIFIVLLMFIKKWTVS
jgi:hypothetical protein